MIRSGLKGVELDVAFCFNETHDTEVPCVEEVRESYVELNPKAKGDLCSEICQHINYAFLV